MARGNRPPTPGTPWVARPHFDGIAKRILAVLVLTAGMAMLVSCGGGGGGTPSGGMPVSTLQITSSPALFAGVDPAITDYVVANNKAAPTQVSVNAPANTTVAVDGHPAAGFSSTTAVSLAAGQSFSFVVNSAGTSKTYYVRCLPADFPVWTTERPGTPQADYYLLTPDSSLQIITPTNYVIVADGYGVPMWWYKSALLPIDLTLLSDGNIAWTSFPTAEEHTLAGALVHMFTGAGILGAVLDTHEMLLLPNGNYLLITNVNKNPVDLSAIGGPRRPR